MSIHYDLHTHSTASDGTLTPTELVQLAREQGVDVLALTDHDSTDGLEEAASAAQQVGIGFVPGIELSVSWKRRTIHIVGLNIDPSYEPLQQGIKKLQEFRDWRAEEMGRRLAKKGIEGAYEGAKKLCKGKILSRTHFAHYIASYKSMDSLRDVFKHYLVNGKPGYVSGEWAELEEGLSWITDAGGQAVIAHPARYGLTATKRRELITDFKECGGVGLEVVSGSHSRDDMYSSAFHAKQHGLLASVGSDYHGPSNPWLKLGKLEALPDGCQAIWSTWPDEQ